MDLGHFETAGGIKPTKIAERGWCVGDGAARRWAGRVATTDIGGSATGVVIATPGNLFPVWRPEAEQLSGTCRGP